MPITLRVAVLIVVLAAATAGPASASLDPAPEVVVRGLKTPWEIVLVPDGRTWLTERDCRVGEVAGSTLRTIYTDTTGVTCRKFLGLELHPGFAGNGFVYLYETYTQGGENRNRIVRLRAEGDGLAFSKVILDGIASDLDHDGGRMRFGPDGKLYVTTGDAHDPALPQNVHSLNGKVLRLNAPGDASDGTAPADNPFTAAGGPAALVWTYGHRHPQGLAWDSVGRLWETEHGPSDEAFAPVGARCCRDEVNLIRRGGNYGWPLIAGSQPLPGMLLPFVHSGDETTWAPGGAAIGTDGNLYVPGLRGRHLREIEVGCEGLGPQRAHFGGATAPRLRAVAVGRGYLWFTTDAERTAGGSPDDRLMRVAMSSDGYLPGSCRGDEASLPPDGFADDDDRRDEDRGNSPGGSSPAKWNERPLTLLLSRTRRALLRGGLDHLRRPRGIDVRSGGWGRGRLEVVVNMVSRGRSPIALATFARHTRSRSAITVRIALNRSKRITLRRRSHVRIQLKVAFAPAGQAPVNRAARITLR